MFGFPIQGFYEKFLILRRIQRDIIVNVQRSSRKLSVVLLGF